MNTFKQSVTTPMNSFKQSVKESPLGPFLQRLYETVSPRARRNGEYDRQTIIVLDRALNFHSNCIDIGAHQGAILKEIILRAPQGQHFAFEPLPHLAAKLSSRFEGVQVLQYALSNQPGHSSFQYVVNSPAYSGLRKRLYEHDSPIIQEIEVEVARLDDMIPADVKIDFIKLDIEGGEYHALQGSIQTIRRCRPLIVFEAGIGSTGQYGVNPEEIHRLFTDEMGYQLSTMKRWLNNQEHYSCEEFKRNWYEGLEYYFMAYPAKASV